MKKVILSVAFLSNLYFVYAQTYRINWSEEIKTKKGVGDLNVVTADNTGLYFTEARMKIKPGFFSATSVQANYKLYKMNKNFVEIYEKDYADELRGLEFDSFQPLGENLYLFATDYQKKGKSFTVYGAKIDKNSGNMISGLAEMEKFSLESKKDEFQMRVSPVKNESSFLVVSNILGKDYVNLRVRLLDKELKTKQSTAITLSFTNEQFTVQDVKLTDDNKIVVLGKEYEETLVGKKKRKKMIFKSYVMMIYSSNGNKEKDILLNSGDRFIISGKLIEQPGGNLLLAGFYSNSIRKEKLRGFFINKIDVKTGELTINSFKEINSSMLGAASLDENEETKTKSKETENPEDDDDKDQFPNDFIIRSVYVNPSDSSIVINSEVLKRTFYFSTSTYNDGGRRTTYTTSYDGFINKDLLIINADKDGNIRWVNAIPKSQREEVVSGVAGPSGSSVSGYFTGEAGVPYYSSFASLIHNNQLILILNDHTNNKTNTAYGKTVQEIYDFQKSSSIYGISIDLATGKMDRKLIAINNGETIPMPRHALVVQNELFIPSWKTKKLAKTKVRFAKILVK